jgi:branched-chain amino acid aminotransferase
MTADSVYIRPFSYTEGAIGVGVSAAPSVYMVSSPVSAYFKEGRSDAIVATRVRATPGGTGYIKTAANYVVSALCKHEAEQQGFAECVFLDAVHHKFFEEGSSSNIMFVLRSGSLVTPELGDTILPGITRKSLLELAKDHGINTEERKISVEEVFSEAVECFVCGTAAGATPIQSLTCDGKRVDFNGGKVGEVTSYLQNTLKGIQYGKLPDTKHWCVRVC